MVICTYNTCTHATVTGILQT